MADTSIRLDHIDNPKVPIKAFDNGDGTYSLQAGTDAVNDRTRVSEVWTAGTLTGPADGATITGVGVLRQLILTNGSGAAITVNVYDNTTASGTKLTPALAIPANSTLIWNTAAPFSLGVYIDYSTPTSCDGIGYYEGAA
jgi:hypothetical protein